MKAVGWMVGASVGSWLAVMAVFGARTGVEVLLGMIAPLVVAVATWLAIEQLYRRNPASVTRFMMTGFAAKMLFFGAYVAVAIRLLAVRPQPFVASLTAYFIGLHLIEALYLRRLFMGAK
jgi:hypothetical protein